MMDAFVLDLDSNPHPRMLAGALKARRAAARFRNDWDGAEVVAFWHGYLEAMADATGCEPDELQSWLNRHEADA